MNQRRSTRIAADSRPQGRFRAIRRWQWLAILASGVLVGLASFGWWWRPARLMATAKSISATNPGRAEQLLHLAIARAGGNLPEAQLELCRLLAAQDRWTEARGAFSLIEHPEYCSPDALLDLARDALAAREYVLPTQVADAIPPASAARPDALRISLTASRELGAQHRLRPLAQELARLAPQDPQAWQVLTDSYRATNEVYRAIDACRKAIELEPDPDRRLAGQVALLQLYLDTEQAAVARQLWNTLPEATRGGDELLLMSARLLRLEGKPDEALELVTAVQRVPRWDIAARMLKGVLLLDAGQTDAAVVELRVVVDELPYSKETHYKLAVALRQGNLLAEARQHFETSRSLNLASEEIVATLGRLEQHPDDAGLLNRLADLYRATGQFAAARRLAPP